VRRTTIALTLASSALLLTVLAAGCSKTTTPSATPTTAATATTAERTATKAVPQPPAATVPPTGHGPVVFYAATSKIETTDNRSWPTWTVHAFDTSLGRDVNSFSFGGVNDFPVAVGLPGQGVVTATETKVVYQRMDGTVIRVLATIPKGETLRDMAVQHDGTTVAITTGNEGGQDGALTFIDIGTGKVLSTLERTDPNLADFGGYFSNVGWLDDDSGVLVRGGAGKEGWTNSATVLLDGSVKVHQMDGPQWYAPGMHSVAITHDFANGFCAAGHELVLRDLGTENVVTTLTDPTKGFLPVEWAPDGSQLLFASWTSPGVDACGAGIGPPSYSLLPAAGGAAQAVEDVAALRASWGPLYAVSLDCPEGSSAPFGGWPQAMLNGTIYLDCASPISGPIPTLKFGDTVIGPVPEAASVYVLGVN